MKNLAIAAAVCVFASAVYAAPPSDASLERLLAATRAELMIDLTMGQLEQSIAQGMNAALVGKNLSAEQRRVVDLAPARLAAVMRQEFNWAALKPAYLGIYREAFDQNEVDGMVAFYESPVGRATMDKMPQVLQRSTAVGQQMFGRLMPRIQAAMRDVLAEAGVRQDDAR